MEENEGQAALLACLLVIMGCCCFGGYLFALNEYEKMVDDQCIYMYTDHGKDWYSCGFTK